MVQIFNIIVCILILLFYIFIIINFIFLLYISWSSIFLGIFVIFQICLSHFVVDKTLQYTTEVLDIIDTWVGISMDLMVLVVVSTPSRA